MRLSEPRHGLCVAALALLHHNRGLHIPPSLLQQDVSVIVVESGHHRNDPPRAVACLLGACVQVHHQVAVRLADAHHRRRRQHVEDELRRRSSFQTGRSGNHLWPDGGGNGEVHEGLQFGARVARDEDDFGRSLSCARQSASHVRRHAAGRHADDDVLLRGLQPSNRTGAVFVAVLGAFLRVKERVLAAGHHRLNGIRIGTERRRHLGRFDHAEPAARASSDEDDPPAFAERFDDDVDANGDARLLALNGREHLAVVVQHQLDDVGR